MKVSTWIMSLATCLAMAICLPASGQDAKSITLPEGIARVGNKYISRKDRMELVLVPEGAFLMGSTNGAPDERPAHKVYLDAFFIDVHEVTNFQFERFVLDSGYEPAGPWKRGYQEGQKDCPVRFVTWHDARAYAKWAGRELPSEAMWEKAARGTRGLTYAWGSSWRTNVSWTDAEVSSGPMAVASFPEGASPYGCLDMGGNVWEWVGDWYDRYHYESLPNDQIVRNPTGPEDGAPPEPRFIETNTAGGNERCTRKVIRGGGWVKSGKENTRCSKRSWGNPSYWLNDTGFRCAVSLCAE